MNLSLCMIVKNEEEVLHRCLSCAKPFVDEIIIVDTGSSDKTKEIAYNFTNKVYDFKWIDDFAAARNYSFSKATGDYIIWLDADDIITKENISKILKLKENYNPNTDIFMFKYNVAFDSNNTPTFYYYRERIIKNSKNHKWESPVHEVINLTGNIVYENISIEHKKIKPSSPMRNLKIFEKAIKNGLILDGRQEFYYGRELFYNNKNIEAISVLEHFLSRDDGWYENKIDACKLLGNLYLQSNNIFKALSSLFYSFIYDEPRSNICCDIGKIFFDTQNYNSAIFWYEIASNRKPTSHSNAFIEPDTFNYIPYMQLCLIYYKLNDLSKSNYYNELAGKIKPYDKNYIYNKNMFSTLKL